MNGSVSMIAALGVAVALAAQETAKHDGKEQQARVHLVELFTSQG